jgi:hypothetical protein
VDTHHYIASDIFFGGFCTKAIFNLILKYALASFIVEVLIPILAV